MIAPADNPPRRPASLLGAAGAIVLTATAVAQTPDPLTRGNAHLREGNIQAALAAYGTSPELPESSDPRLALARATAQLAAAQPDLAQQAEADLRRIISAGPDDPQLLRAAHANLGAAILARAEAAAQSDRPLALDLFQQSAASYLAASRLDRSDLDAARNVEHARLRAASLRDDLQQNPPTPQEQQSQQQRQQQSDPTSAPDQSGPHEQPQNQPQNQQEDQQPTPQQQDAQRLAEQLQQLADEQQQEAQQSAESRQDPGAADQQQALSDAAQQQLEDLEQQLEQLQQQRQAGDPDQSDPQTDQSAASADEAMQQARESLEQAREAQREAEQSLAQDQQPEAGEAQQRAADHLRQAAERMQQAADALTPPQAGQPQPGEGEPQPSEPPPDQQPQEAQQAQPGRERDRGDPLVEALLDRERRQRESRAVSRPGRPVRVERDW